MKGFPFANWIKLDFALCKEPTQQATINLADWKLHRITNKRRPFVALSSKMQPSMSQLSQSNRDIHKQG